MRFMAATLIAIILAGLGSAAKADDFPPRKPGLWEVSMSSGATQRPPMLTRLCVDATSDAAMYKASMDNPGVTCSRREVVRSGLTVTIDSICTMGQRTISSHMTTVFTSDTAYHTEMMSHFEPPIAAGRPDSGTTQDAKWIGPCPADMKPGDLVMANGVKINIIEAQKGAK